MQDNYAKIQAAGLELAAISYDSQAVLKTFAQRKGITFPLLSDPDSKIIREYGIFNTSVEKTSPAYGVPNPGIYFLDKQGIVKAKYFEDDYKERQTAAVILMRELGIQPDTKHTSVTAKHLTLSASASTGNAHMGQHVSLLLDIDLPARVHVYAPGVKGYIAIDWKQSDTQIAKQSAAMFPPAKLLFLDAIKEEVPVYQGHFRLTRDIIFASDKEIALLVDKDGNFTLQGTLRYQACDDEKCFLPETVPVAWTFHFEPLDRIRAK